MTLERPDDLLDRLHAATDRATIVTVPERRMLALDGVGAPTGFDFGRAIEALHAVADRLRARVRRRHRVDTRVGAVECAWWIHPEPPFDEVPEHFRDRANWHWQLMIEIPAAADDEDVQAAIEDARAAEVPHVDHVRSISFAEGRSAQILQVGGRAAAARAVELLYREVGASGLHPHGHLHEIYLTDPRRVSADRARVILRLPIEAPPDR